MLFVVRILGSNRTHPMILPRPNLGGPGPGTAAGLPPMMAQYFKSKPLNFIHQTQYAVKSSMLMLYWDRNCSEDSLKASLWTNSVNCRQSFAYELNTLMSGVHKSLAGNAKLVTPSNSIGFHDKRVSFQTCKDEMRQDTEGTFYIGFGCSCNIIMTLSFKCMKRPMAGCQKCHMIIHADGTVRRTNLQGGRYRRVNTSPQTM